MPFDDGYRSNIDLHAHTNASDGILSPVDLINRALTNNVSVLSITDHDTLTGFNDAIEHARISRMTLIPGVEFSALWQGRLVHVVGLAFNPSCERLIQGLAKERTFQSERIESIGNYLEEEGAKDLIRRASLLAGDASNINLWHYANVLCEDNRASDIATGVKSCANIGKKIGFYSSGTSMEAAISLIKEASGVSVLAHPMKYRSVRINNNLQSLFVDFKGAGGEAVELYAGNLVREQVDLIYSLMKKAGLWGTIGSDFHGSGRNDVDVGNIPLYDPYIQEVFSNLENVFGLKFGTLEQRPLRSER